MYWQYGDDEGTLDTLIELTITISEHYDIADDVVDESVAPGQYPDAIVAMELLMPLFIRRLHRLGTDAVEFWTERSLSLIESPYREMHETPSVDAYRQILQRQSNLFGFVTGLAPVAAGADETAIERAERIGREFYIYEQYMVDREGYDRGEAGAWNIWELVSEDQAVELMNERAGEITDLASVFPKETQTAIRALVAQDIPQWLEQNAERIERT